MVRPKIILACVIGFAAETAPAADWTERLIRNAELTSHRKLARLRNDPATEIATFTTDGCSGGLSSLWSYVAGKYPAFAEAHGGHPPWEECCVVHDRSYYRAGPVADPDASYNSRLTADIALRVCVEDTADTRDQILEDQYGMTEVKVRAVYAGIAESMYLAVRFGGAPCTGLPWRWGYAYPQCWQPRRE